MLDDDGDGDLARAALEAIVESISTLKFANRAKHIQNKPILNEDLDQKSLLRKYERELKRLRAELEERSRNVVDKRRLLELDEQRRRAEADKMAAIRALEARRARPPPRSREAIAVPRDRSRAIDRARLRPSSVAPSVVPRARVRRSRRSIPCPSISIADGGRLMSAWCTSGRTLCVCALWWVCAVWGCGVWRVAVALCAWLLRGALARVHPREGGEAQARGADPDADVADDPRRQVEGRRDVAGRHVAQRRPASSYLVGPGGLCVKNNRRPVTRSVSCPP